MCKNVVTRVYTTIDTKIRITNKQTVYWITKHDFNNVRCEDDFWKHCPRPICEHLHATVDTRLSLPSLKYTVVAWLSTCLHLSTTTNKKDGPDHICKCIMTNAIWVRQTMMYIAEKLGVQHDMLIWHSLFWWLKPSPGLYLPKSGSFTKLTRRIVKKYNINTNLKVVTWILAGRQATFDLSEASAGNFDTCRNVQEHLSPHPHGIYTFFCAGKVFPFLAGDILPVLEGNVKSAYLLSMSCEKQISCLYSDLRL